MKKSLCNMYINLLYKAEKPSVRLRHADNLAVSAPTEMGLARNEHYVFEEDRVYS